MKRCAKSACPAPWSAHSGGHGSATPAASPAQPSMPSPAPRVPVAGCRGKGLLSIPPAVGRPAWAQTPSIKGRDGSGGYMSVMPLGKGTPQQTPARPTATSQYSTLYPAASSQVSFTATVSQSPHMPFTIPAFPEVAISKIPRTSFTSSPRPQASSMMATSSSILSLASSSSSRPPDGHARKAAPPVYNHVRGNKKRALDVAACDEEMERAMATYVGDWRSAGDTSEDYWRSWQQLHAAHWDGWRRPAAHALPLDALKIHVVGALLKVGGYRSSYNYLGVAKTRHAELGFPWGPELELAARRFNLSTRRGAGPRGNRSPSTSK